MPAESVMSYFHCEEIGDKWVLVADVRVECFDELWWSFVILPFVGGVLYIVMFPLGLLFVINIVRVLVGVSGANYSFPVTGMGTMLPASLDAVISAYNGEWSGSLPVRAFELRMTFDVASGGSLDVEAFDGDVPVGGFQQSGPVTALTRSVTADRIDGFKVTGSGITT